MTARNHPVAFSTLLCAALLLIPLSFLPWACTPEGPSSGCLTSTDCPQGQLCIGTNCLGKVNRDATPRTDQAPTDQGPRDTGPQPEPPTPERPDQSTPEPTSDATQSDTTPDTPVCRLDELRTCQHGCGAGTQRCIVDANGAAAWAPCKPKATKQSCYSGSANTVGVGLCKAGTQICDGEKWGPCEGEIVPIPEVCGDGKDNDCNGKTDESEAGCQCNPKETQACGSDVGECQKGTQTCSEGGKWSPCAGDVGPQQEACDGKDNDCDGMVDNLATLGSRCTIMGKLGPCAEGKRACVQDQLICQQLTMPAKETCDGIDNDCDGQIDNNIAGVGVACTIQGQQGECAKGTTRCQSGAVVCVANASPTTEICRDGKDNDCDGKVDEICGAKVQMAIVNGNGTVAYKTPGIAGITRTAAGNYDIATKDTCGTMYPFVGKVPMFVVPRSSTPRSSGYICDAQTGKYKLVIGGNGPANTPFYVAFPSKRNDEAYGSVSFSCAMGGACTIHYAQRGNATIQRTASGTYDISSTSCKSANQPYFAQAYMNTVGSFVTMAFVSPGKCRVYTFASNGALNNAISFSYWIPSPTAMAWASIDSNGKVVAANIFGDQRAKWSAKINRNMGSFANMDVQYSGWNKSSVPMITPATSGKYAVTAGSKSGGFLTYPFTLPSTPRALPRMSIMFLQP